VGLTEALAVTPTTDGGRMRKFASSREKGVGGLVLSLSPFFSLKLLRTLDPTLASDPNHFIHTDGQFVELAIGFLRLIANLIV
jgi:hypothetical protein